jgi:hypothetical protein
MRAAIFNRVSIVWIVLLGLTVVSVVVSRRLGSDGAYGLGPAAVMIIAFTKARIVGLEYMALRNAPWALRLLFEGWVIVIGTALVAVSVVSLSAH